MDEGKKIEITLKPQQDEERTTIDLRALGRRIRNMKKIAIISTIFALLGGITVGVVQNTLHTSHKVQLLVGFGFAGIEEGEDPAGGDFDIRKMSAPAVVVPALERAGLEDILTVEAVRKAITFQGLVPQNIQDKIGVTRSIAQSDASALEELLDISYHPSEYLLTLDLQQAGLDIDEGTWLLDAIAQTYQDQFLETYSHQKLLAEIPPQGYMDYDYSEAADILAGMLSTAQRFTQEMADSAPTFRSTETGFTFSDLTGILETLQKVDITSIHSIIFADHLTKDADAMRARYAYRIQTVENELAAVVEQLASMDETIEGYQRGTTTMIHDDSGAVTTILADSDTYDRLITQRIALSSEVATLHSTLAQLQQDYAEITAHSPTASSADAQARVEEMLLSVSERLERCIVQINATAQDYYKTVAYHNAVKVKVPAHLAREPRSNVVKNCVVYALIASVAVWSLLVIIAIFTSLLSGELLQNHGQGRPHDERPEKEEGTAAQSEEEETTVGKL